MQNINQLRHFQLVAREGSFARASELANITQPALSNSIRSLEEKLGFELVERSARPVGLTPMGQAILPRIDALLFEARNLAQEVENLSTGTGGHVRVGMTATTSTSLGGPIVAEWHQAHPGVSLELVIGQTTALLPGLHEERYDLIVGDTRDLPRHSRELDLVALPSQAGGAYCRTGHPILSIPHPVPADLARYRFAATQFPEEVREAVLEYIGLSGGDSHFAVDSNNIALLRDAVVESDLILLTTGACVRNELALGVLRRVPIDFDVRGDWAIATLRNRVAHPAVPALARKIREISERVRDRRLSPYVTGRV